ncbi:LLM class flavin-dependent oxidoreductase [Salipaludibacillus neizhouensis]|uniref:LLM class flavin-dependent oxidoreductase n=1 Tax=Salipaludibacillus neizhouensis TaxID=885475 RepID=A0A3A9KFB3_9BACI|nr:LLM class flavin-dependent oxidoreductase [Salipaludibacillus neizhouensis]RKL69271.1 LLM class flavin-dependent oxidoreductase [Salipaludibacillus neizhouensis]
MNLSILDQSPVSSGATASDALQASMLLAQEGEKLGYKRYWIAEHHNYPALATSSPEVMLGYIGANTSSIRIGAGAILLPHYKPYKVAETFHLLATLFPGRVDLGIGRSPGGSAEAMIALSGNFLENVRKTPQLVEELLYFINRSFPNDHQFAQLNALPIPDVNPETWLLGTSGKSANLAAEKGLSYAFGHFMTEKDGPSIVQQYRQHFRVNSSGQPSQVIVAVSVICAETEEEAYRIALSCLLWSIQASRGVTSGIPSVEEARAYSFNKDEKKILENLRSRMVIGNVRNVIEQLRNLQSTYKADEIMIVTITHSYKDRLKSYELIAEELALYIK